MVESNLKIDEQILNLIYNLRGKKVMIDRDLATLFGIQTRRLKEAVRRNLARFPEDFMFEMSLAEMEEWRKSIHQSAELKMGLRYPPFCFTEQGVTMLSCILNSDQAIKVNIRIIRVFTLMREMILTHKDILLKLEQVDKVINIHDDEIRLILSALKQLINQKSLPRKSIGFKSNNSSEI